MVLQLLLCGLDQRFAVVSFCRPQSLPIGYPFYLCYAKTRLGYAPDAMTLVFVTLFCRSPFSLARLRSTLPLQIYQKESATGFTRPLVSFLNAPSNQRACGLEI